MRLAVFSADPVVGESLACLFKNMGGYDVVACLSHLGAAAGVIKSQRPEILVLTEDFLDEVSRFAVRKLKKDFEIQTVLLHASEAPSPILFEEFDLVQSRWEGVGALFEAVARLGGFPMEARPLGTHEPSAFERAPIRLTARERETADLVAQGLTNAQIASRLGISEATVKVFVSRLLRAYECDNRVQLALRLSGKGNSEARPAKK